MHTQCRGEIDDIHHYKTTVIVLWYINGISSILVKWSTLLPSH